MKRTSVEDALVQLGEEFGVAAVVDERVDHGDSGLGPAIV